jgi:hypothetical protein
VSAPRKSPKTTRPAPGLRGAPDFDDASIHLEEARELAQMIAGIAHLLEDASDHGAVDVGELWPGLKATAHMIDDRLEGIGKTMMSLLDEINTLSGKAGAR